MSMEPATQSETRMPDDEYRAYSEMHYAIGRAIEGYDPGVVAGTLAALVGQFLVRNIRPSRLSETEEATHRMIRASMDSECGKMILELRAKLEAANAAAAE